MKREPRCFLFRFYFPARRMASTAFCTCRRFSASSKISGACCSNTAEEISSPRWAGRQCSTMTSGFALSSSLLVSWKPTKSRRRCSLPACRAWRCSTQPLPPRRRPESPRQGLRSGGKHCRTCGRTSAHPPPGGSSAGRRR